MMLFFVQCLEARILADEFRYQVLHRRHNLHLVVRVAYVHQVLDAVLHLVVVILPHRGNHDFLVIRRLRQLLHVQQLLVQLFAVAQARELNLHVRPDRLIMRFARSRIFTGLPMSKM